MTDESDIADITNRCSAFIYPGELGLSLIQAMEYYLLAIGHGQPRLHVPEIAAFRDRATGLAIACGNARVLTQSIATMLSDPARFNSFASAAAKIVERSFTTQGMANRFQALVNFSERAS